MGLTHSIWNYQKRFTVSGERRGFLNLQQLQMEEMFGHFYKKVWPLLPRTGANFSEKTP
jgi:hypothetical protein